MRRKPRGDTTAGGEAAATHARPGPEWDRVLAHRPPRDGHGNNQNSNNQNSNGAGRDETAQRFIASGVSADEVAAALADGGDTLYRAAAAAQPDDDTWAEPFGGLLAVALLAAEVSAFTSHLNSRAAGVRSLAVDRLLDDLSAVAAAAHLGVSRQKVYDIARGGLTGTYIDTVPWRHS